MTKCFEQTRITSVVAGFASMTTDTLILVLPMPIIFQLHLPRVKKIGLALVFCTGIL